MTKIDRIAAQIEEQAALLVARSYDLAEAVSRGGEEVVIAKEMVRHSESNLMFLMDDIQRKARL